MARRLSLSALCCLLLALCSGSPAAGFERGLAPSSAGQLALLAALAGRGSAVEDPDDEDEPEFKEVDEEDGKIDTMDPEEILADLDTTKDGFLELEDFMDPERPLPDEEKEQLKTMLAKADTDGDGKVSKEEIPALMKEFEREHDEPEL
uniref:EF-hand domain-containing protein n=1 Tax=Alexandrium monilatum TaxID=311494 RepID=A0A7S4V0T5_9DINO|mmetsp:Transcript_14315/g.42607  ORF Transcript_14315/g.42607 Transcript_14315/m.42607 type:complete len:149 (-) Transcript_14315:140-586(-)